MTMYADLLIIGAGPAGMAAARVAVEGGRRVLLIDDNPAPGGQIWRSGPNARMPRRAQAARAGLERPGIMLWTGARLVGRVGRSIVLVEGNDAAENVAYQQLILCTGARERMLPFPGWTQPGVTGAGGLQALIKSGVDVVGKRIVIAGSGPLLLAAASTARRANAQVLRIAEQADTAMVARFMAGLWRWPNKVAQTLALANAQYRASSRVVEACGAEALEAVCIERADGRRETMRCDYLATGFGLVPNTDVATLLGCRIASGRIVVDDQQSTSVPDCLAAGECVGIGGQELASIEGEIAGRVALGQRIDERHELYRKRAHWQAFATSIAQAFALRDDLRGLVTDDTLVCRCEDVSHGTIRDETSWDAAKLSRRCGMGACQGRICGPATAFLYGWSEPDARLPTRPVRVQTLLDIDR